jgi:hypothetical protein
MHPWIAEQINQQHIEDLKTQRESFAGLQRPRRWHRSLHRARRHHACAHPIEASLGF